MRSLIVTLPGENVFCFFLDIETLLWILNRAVNQTMQNEPRHDKTNKVSVSPAKTQISLGIRPIGSESSLSAWRNLGSLATHWVHSEDSDLTGRTLGAHSFCWFCHVVAQMFYVPSCHIASQSHRILLKSGKLRCENIFLKNPTRDLELQINEKCGVNF